MMPITAIAGEPRRIEAHDGADLARAEPSNKSIKARPCDGPTGRPTHIVVDDFDVCEAALAGNLDKIILSPLALQIGHDLGLRRLAHVDDGFALEHACWKKITACHRQAPRR